MPEETRTGNIGKAAADDASGEAGGSVPLTVAVRLTRLQRAALVGLLVDQSFRRDGVQEWVDVLTDEVVTLDDLLTLLSKEV